MALPTCRFMSVRKLTNAAEAAAKLGGAAKAEGIKYRHIYWTNAPKLEQPKYPMLLLMTNS